MFGLNRFGPMGRMGRLGKFMMVAQVGMMAYNMIKQQKAKRDMRSGPMPGGFHPGEDAGVTRRKRGPF